jgi:short-subunit dehydrogenase
VGHYFSSQERLLQLKQRPDEQRNSLELIRGDLATDEGVGRFLAEATSRFSEVDVIVNIASPNMNRLNVDEISWKDISNNFRSQIEVPIELAKIYLPKMKSKSFGRIIGVSTQFAHGTPRAGQLQYILG